MYSKQILTVLGAAGVVFVTAAFSFQVRTPFWGSADSTATVATSNVMESVEKNLEGLNTKVHSRMPASAKVEILRSTLSTVAELRKQGPLQTVDKEIYMDFATESLQHVAQDPQFSVKKCSEYKARIMNDFEPYSEKMPSHPALKRSYQIIEGICS